MDEIAAILLVLVAVAALFVLGFASGHYATVDYFKKMGCETETVLKRS